MEHSWQAFCPALSCIEPGKVCKNRTRQLGRYASRELAREAQLHHLHTSSNHYMEKFEATLIDGDDYIEESIDAPGPSTRPARLRSRSPRPSRLDEMRSEELDLQRRIALLNDRFAAVMKTLVRAEQATLQVERVARAAAEAMAEDAKTLRESIAALTASRLSNSID